MDLNFNYLDKAESTFLLSLLRNADCLHCPDFHFGCVGSHSHATLMTMQNKEYLENHKPGTEAYLCGKLRNIIIAEDVVLNDILDQYNLTIKSKIGYLTKDTNRCVVNDLSLDMVRENLESEYQRQLQKVIREANEKLLQIQKDIRAEYEVQLNEMKEYIRKISNMDG